MRILSFVKPFAFCSALWMLVDMVLDVFTVKGYKNECDMSNSTAIERTIYIGNWRLKITPPKEDITCYLWPLGALVMILPTLAMVVYIFVCGGHEGRPWWEKIAYGPFYIIVAPVFVILASSVHLCCGSESSDQKKNQEKAAYLKLAEALCEALPQVAITYGYFVVKGMPWNTTVVEINTFRMTWLPFLSSIFSTVMVIIGTISGAMACHKVREEESNQRNQEAEQKLELRLIRRRKDNMLTKCKVEDNPAPVPPHTSIQPVHTHLPRVVCTAP